MIPGSDRSHDVFGDISGTIAAASAMRVGLGLGVDLGRAETLGFCR